MRDSSLRSIGPPSTACHSGSMTKVSIVGAGAVGTAIAYAAQIRGVCRQLSLFDLDAQKVRAEVLDLIAEPVAGGWRIAADGGELRFVLAKDGRGEGLSEFDVAVHDPASVHAAAKARGCIDTDGNVVLSGTRVRLVPA